MGQGRLIAVGRFDGVHIGHQSLLSQGREFAANWGLKLSAYTFPPQGEAILTLAAKRRLLSKFVDEIIIVPFEEIADLPPEEFVRDELVGRLGARGVVLGPDHRFGRGRAGGLGLLKRLSWELGFMVHVVDPVTIEGEPVSAQRIRKLIREGQVEKAARLLGRPPVTFGKPLSGAGLAAKLGFPTINLALFPELVRPKDGVYAAWAYWPTGGGDGLFYIGKRPTFPDLPPSVELHLFSPPKSPPGEPVEVHLIARLRGDEQFPSAQALAAQIARDRDKARQYLASLLPPSPILAN